MRPIDLPPSLTAGTFRPGVDDAAILDLVTAYHRCYLQRAGEPATAVLAQIAQLPDGGRRDALLVRERRGDPVGLLVCETARAEAALAEEPEHWFDVFVVPGKHTGRLENPLVATGLARLSEHRGNTGTARVQSGTARADTATNAALAGHGMAHVRTFWELERTLSAEDDDPGPAPAGVRVRLAGDDAAGRALLHRLIEASFAGHWGHHERSAGQWWADRMSRVGQDPTQWWVADLAGEPVAACLGESSRADSRAGYLALLGVLDRARGRGIARHLLRVAFAEHRRRTWVRTALRVDSANATGATALYRSVGMEEIEVFDVYERTIRAEPTTREPS